MISLFNFESIAQIILILINFIGILLAWWMVRSGSTKKTKVWFIIMTIFILFWANSSYFGSRSSEKDISQLYYKLNISAVALFLPSFYKFYVIHFLGKRGWPEKIGDMLTFISFAFLLSTLLTDWVIYGVIPREWGMEIIFGPLGDLFNVFSALVAFLVVYFSLEGYRSFNATMKRKTRLFLIGVFIFILANLIFNVGSQLIFNSVQYQILGDFSSIFLLGFTTYATIQHGLFEVKTIATEALTAIILATLFSRILVSENLTERTLDILVFILTTVFGYLLVRSVRYEVTTREQLQKLTTKLKELDKKKDEFISVAAHELRAPMTGIKGYLSMISQGDSGEIPPQTKEYLHEAMKENDRLIRLVNNMLNVSRIEEGRMVFDMGEVRLTEVAKTVFNEFKSSANEKMLAYGMEIQEGVNDKVYVDRDRIHEVVANLVSNAIKYTDSGSVTVKIFNTSSDLVRLEVHDTGSGLTQEEQMHLFQKFYRAESNIGKVMGTGLGLFISMLLIEKFGGTISVNSVKGKGSTFWFELPVRK